jgi:pyruvate/2-oxoglutarate dehydrogenase complex dihydrolipoamide dehydrogenase (E3) component
VSEIEAFDLCVIGGGSAGIAIATGAALLGVPVALVEPGPPGADGLEELAAAAFFAASARLTDLSAIRRHVAETVAAAEPAVAPERLRALGVTLIEGHARFLGPDRIAVAAGPLARTLTARRFVLTPATVPVLPSVPGLGQVPVLTPSALPALDRVPEHLAILGGSAAALAWAQAWRRLGSAVTLIDAGPLLPDEDPELAELLCRALAAEDVRLLDRTPVQHIAGSSGSITLTLGPPEATEILQASHLLVAAGRRPDREALGLDAGLPTTNKRATNKRIHVVENAAEAGTVLRRILFRQRQRFDSATPRLVRTDPPLAQVGQTERQARDAGHAVTLLRAPLHDLDAARALGRPHEVVKIVTDRRGRILGAGIVAPHAPELIQAWQLAIAQGLTIGAMANLAMPYPSLGEASKRAAGAFFAPKLLSARTRKLVRWLARLG